jgi:hypothetical protein
MRLCVTPAGKPSLVATDVRSIGNITYLGITEAAAARSLSTDNKNVNAIAMQHKAVRRSNLKFHDMMFSPIAHRFVFSRCEPADRMNAVAETATATPIVSSPQSNR